MFFSDFLIGRFLSLFSLVAIVCMISGGRPVHARQHPDRAAGSPFVHPEDKNDILPLIYAYVKEDNIPVYKDPAHASTGIPPVRRTAKGSIWVSLSQPQPIIWKQQAWYRINPNEYVRADNLRLYGPSQFQGIFVPRYFNKRFAWLIFDTRVSEGPGAVPSEDAPVLPKRTLVIIYEIKKVGELDWCRIGEDQWVEYRWLGVVIPTPRPNGVKKNERWIDVNLFEQTLAAYEGDQLVYATLISSGKAEFPTKQGLFRIWIKARQAKMSGGGKNSGYYYLEDVPWHMYFFQSYSMHGTYWHDNFGIPHSHGCINLAPKDAKWLFGWMGPRKGKTNWIKATTDDPGTWVWVHE